VIEELEESFTNFKVKKQDTYALSNNSKSIYFIMFFSAALYLSLQLINTHFSAWGAKPPLNSPQINNFKTLFVNY